MSRISQAICYLNAETSVLTNDWIKNNLTHTTVNESLKELRKTRMKEKRANLKNTEKTPKWQKKTI